MVFAVNRYPLQRGRGLGGIFANIFKKVIPYGKSFLKEGVNMGKTFINSDTGKDILKDTIDSAAAAAATALIEKKPEEAKANIVKSFKRSKTKSKNYAKKIVKNKIDRLLIGKGMVKGKKRNKRNLTFKTNSLLDD